MTNDILTERLKYEMKKKNWSGRNLSKTANLSYNAIHYILSGKNKSTTFEVVSAIACPLTSSMTLIDQNPFLRSLNPSRVSKILLNHVMIAEKKYQLEEDDLA